jgi:hypothetical protein
MDMKMLQQEYQHNISERQVAAGEWQRIAEYLIPQMQSIQKTGFEGYKKTGRIFDTTGIDALDKLTTLIIGTLTSDVVPWFAGEFSDPDINLLPEVQFWLADTSSRMYHAINESNYKVVGPGVIRDIVGFGTGGMFVNEVEPEYAMTDDFRGVAFDGLPIGTYTMQENGMADIRQATREFRLPVGEVLKRWPKGDYSDQTRKLAMDRPFERVSVVHDVRSDRSRYKSCYYMAGRNPLAGGMFASTTQFEPAHESFFHEWPMMFPRWDKATGEVWGFGRGHLALPEVATLNRARQLKLRQWALAVNPPLLAIDDGVINNPKIIPGGITRIRVDGALRPLEIGARFDHASIPENESKLQIRQIFYTEQILQFAPQAKTPPSATEVAQRMQFLHQLLGPSTGRLKHEFLGPLLHRTLNIMERAGAILPRPAIMHPTLGHVRFNFEGPLARSQRADELRALGDTLAVVSNIQAYQPNVVDNYDWDEIARDTSRITGLNRRYVKTIEQREEKRQADQEAQAQQAQLAQMQQGAAAAKDMGAAQKNFSEAQQP